MNFARPFSADTLVKAAVNVVLPWSTCPIVPIFTCGFRRSYFAFAIPRSLPSSLKNQFDYSPRYLAMMASEICRGTGSYRSNSIL